MLVDFNKVFNNFQPPPPPPEYEEVVCGRGCLCILCNHRNPNPSIKKEFYDEVLCIRERGRCSQIKQIDR